MKNMLSSRLFNAGLILSAAVLAPVAALAQDASLADNASNFIGGLVIWLLPIGGAFAVFAMISSDKQAQQTRANTIVRR